MSADSMMVRKNLNISQETYDKLKSVGKFGESFDDLLSRLVDISLNKEAKTKK